MSQTLPLQPSLAPQCGIVLEDMPATRQWLLSALEEAFPGIETYEAATVAQAARLIEILSFRAAPERILALIDLRLPDGSGIETVRLCCERGIIPVISTIHDDPASLLGALQAGAQGYLLKDHPLPQLVQYLRRIGGGEPPLSPPIARHILHLLQNVPSLPPAKPSDDASLSPREAQVLQRIGQGLRVADVAVELGLTESTIASYIKSVYRKLNISSRAEAALKARDLGLLE